MNYALMVIGLFTATVTTVAQPDLSCDEAVKIGIAGSRILGVSSEKTGAAEARKSEVSSNLLPSVKFDAGYRRLSDVDPFQIKVPFSPQPITVAPTVLDNYSLHAGIQQPLFTGFRLLSNARAADALARASRSDLRNDEDELRFAIIAAYWTVYQTLQTQDYVRQNVVRLESYQSDTRRLVDAGLATRNDLLRIEVQLNTARLGRIDAENDVQLATMNLNNLIGKPLESEWQFTSHPDTSYAVAGDTGSLRDSVFSLRPDMEALSARIEASKASVSSARGGYWPQLMFNGNYYYQRPNSRWQPTRDEFLSAWDVGIQLQFDVWNWGQTSAQVSQAQSVLRQNELLFDQLKENVRLDVRRSTLSLQRTNEKVGVARVTIDQAEENVRSLREKYQAGLSTSTELLDANVALLQAKTTYTGALVERETARARLAKAAGEWHR
jgi:outer membrane protein